MTASSRSPAAEMSHRLLLGRRLLLHLRLRQVLALLLLLAVLVTELMLELTSFTALPLVICAILITIYNFGIYQVVRHRSPKLETESRQALHARALLVAALFDFLALGVCTWWTGGVRSPLLPIYLIHVIVGCILLNRRSAIGLAAAAYASIALQILLEAALHWQPPMPLSSTTTRTPLGPTEIASVLLAWALLLVAVCFLLLTVVRELRRRESMLHEAQHDLEALSEFRRDFLQITIHNLRSPIGVAVAHLQNVLRGYGGELNDTQRGWIERVEHRLQGLQEFLRSLRMLVVVDSSEAMARANSDEVDVASLLAELVDDYRDHAELSEHSISLDVRGDVPKLRASRELLREAIANYITNAIRYTPPGGNIRVHAREESGFVVLEVEDDGIGIAPENQPKLFQDFVRLDIDDARISDASGTGLGLAIVRRVAESFGGSVFVQSRPGHGSKFGIRIPASTPD